MMFRQDRWTFGISVVVLALASVCVAQAASAQATGSIVEWGNVSWDLPTPNRNFAAVAAGGLYGLGLRHNGSIVAWGANSAGRCDVPEPNSDFVAISAGHWHNMGLKADGSIVVWGLDAFGIRDVPEPNNDFVAISTGYGHSLGLKADGSVLVWGINHYGQCDTPSPNTGFFAISASGDHSVGLRVDSGEEPPPPPETGTIEGRVFGPDGEAVKGALVVATDPDGNTWDATSRPKTGSYSLTELPAWVLYTVEAMKDGVGYDVVVEVPVIAGETTPVDLYLEP